jgi:lysophospholipase L1-like esterase
MKQWFRLKAVSRRQFVKLSAASLALVLAGLVAGPSAVGAPTPHWFASWGFSQQALGAQTVSNGTVRMIARPTLSGSSVRVQLQNTFGTTPLVVGAATLGARANGALLAPGSNRPLTFGGSSSVTIPAGGAVYSDPVSFTVHAWQDVAVSLYIPGAAMPSQHTNSRTTSFWTANGAGDHTSDAAAAAFTQTTTSTWWLAAIDVLSSSADGSVAFLGDSITDGTGTTTDGHDRWHDIIALRSILPGKPNPEVGLVNEGIGGNRITDIVPGGSPAAVDRLDRDVLARSGLSHVVFFEGTNDIAAGVTADQVIEGMKNIITRVHAAGVPIYGVTIIPRHNAAWTPQMTEYRHVVNDFIRHQADFDAVIDFDAVMRDPAKPDLMNPILDLGDHIHPNVFGYLRMGQAVPLQLFERQGHRP